MVPGATILAQHPGTRSAYWTYSFRAKKRDDLVQKLVDHGIAAQRLHVRNDRYSCFSPSSPGSPLTGVEIFDAENISIPCGWWIDEESRQRIIDCISSGW
jgi:perosamine synthetase